jgi:fructose-1,6-bisphosphatase
VRTHADIRITEDTQEFAVNVSDMRRWEPPVKRYIDECPAGKDGRLRLMYEANPIRFEKRGGAGDFLPRRLSGARRPPEAGASGGDQNHLLTSGAC